MYNKSQIGVFVIFSVILVLGGIFFYSNYFNSQKENLEINYNNLNIDETSLKNYVQSCLDENTKLGVYYLADNGGYIYSYNSILLTKNKQIAYAFKQNKNISLTEEFMKGELRRFIEESMFSCIKDYNQNNEYKILAEKPKINIDFYGEGIDIDMNFPLTINFEDSVVELSSFRTILPIRLKHILDIKNEILSNNLNYVDFETLLVYDVSISILPYDKNNFVYSIYDEKSNIGVDPFIYNFAVEIDNNINLAPQIKANLTQVAFVDEEFNLNLNIFDNENDTLKFFVDSSLFDFPIQNQILNFIPNDAEIGNYKILIKVSDGFNEVNEYLYLEVRER